MHTVSDTLVNESPYAGLREVSRMAGPIIAGSLSFTVMQFVDQALVARLGTPALAAVGSAGLWSFILLTFFLGIIGCVSTFVSQCLGRDEKHKCASYTWQGIYLSLCMGVLALVFWPFAETIFGLMGHSEEVTRLEVTYFRVRLLGYFFTGWQAGTAAFFQAVNRPVIPMLVAIVANIVNIVLDVLLIFGLFGFPRLEIAGAALATVISLGIQGVLLQAVFLSRPFDKEFGTRATFRPDWARMAQLYRIGWPAGLSFFLDIFNWGIFTSVLVGRFGDAQLAAHTTALNFIHLSFMPALGLNHAIAPIVGQWIGRGKVAVAKARSYTALKMAMVYMTVVGITLALFGKPLIRLFFSEDPDVVRVGALLLILAATFQAFDAINIVLFGALRGAGDTRWIALVTCLGAYFVFLPIASFFALHGIPVFPEGFLAAWPLPRWVIPGMGWEAVGAWGGATLYIIGLSGVVFLRFRGEKWRHIDIFAGEIPEAAPVAPAPEDASCR